MSDINVPTIIGAQEETFSQGCFFPDLQECKFGNTPAAPDGEIHSDGFYKMLDAVNGFVFTRAGVAKGYLNYHANEFVRALDNIRNSEGSGGYTTDMSRYFSGINSHENLVTGYAQKQHNSGGVWRWDSMQIAPYDGAFVAYGAGGIFTDCGSRWTGTVWHHILKRGLAEYKYGATTKWQWDTNSLRGLDNYPFAWGNGGHSTDCSTRFTGTNRIDNVISGYHEMQGNGNGRFRVNPTGISWFAAPCAAQQTVIGAKGGNVALANLLTALATYGLIIDNTT